MLVNVMPTKREIEMAEKKARKLKMLADEERRKEGKVKRTLVKEKFFNVCPQFRDPFPEDMEDTRPIEIRGKRKFSERLDKVKQRWAEGKDHEGKERI